LYGQLLVSRQFYRMSNGCRLIVLSSTSIAISTVAGSIFTTALFGLLSWCWSSWCGAATIGGGYWILGRNKRKVIGHIHQVSK